MSGAYDTRKWLRKKPEALFGKSIPFQLVDLDHVAESGSVVVRLFGITEEGHSICVRVRGYRPYFYAMAPKGFDEKNCYNTATTLDNLTTEGAYRGKKEEDDGGKGGPEKAVTKVELVTGTSLYHYTEEKSRFLKIYLTSPKHISSCQKSLSEALGGEEIQSFESNIDFEIRFMADRDIVGCGWLEVPAGKYSQAPRTQTTCQLEVEVSVEDLIVHPSSVPRWAGVAPLRTLSFDIECAGRRGIFPEPSQDPVIQIANIVKLENEDEPFIKNCFVLGDCVPVIGAEIIVFEREKDMLEKWFDFVRTVDPDLLTGYNIQNFDLPYLIERAKHLKVEPKLYNLGRVKGSFCRIRDASNQAKIMGNRVNKIISMEGRIVFDIFQLIRRDYSLRSYTLNSVSYHFLGEQKEDVEYNMITELFNGNANDRRRLAVYCIKDAYLPLKLAEKLMLFINYMEMARVTGVPLNFLVSRGQQVKVISQLLRKTKHRNIFLPTVERRGGGGDEVNFEGATVIEPMRGYYNEPIATLDFASLYPSIMIAHNLCYTTHLRSVSQGMVEGEDFIKSPSGDLFVKAKRRRGLLPEILEDLLSARKKAKLELKNETDPFKKMVLNGRQLALKIAANSVYGFTGATIGKLPCLEISQSVTAFGRMMIEMTKSEVEATFKKGAVEGKCPQDAIVIYGDTDSVMVKFGVESVAEAMELGRRAAEEISKRFVKPIRLEFEKVYFPYLLINKKRYAGLYYTRAEKHDKMDCKGLETVRRDNCPLVPSVLNTCLEKLMIDRDREGAINYVKRVISDLRRDRIDISMLIITKELTKKGENYQAKQAHVELAEKIRQRDPGSAPRLGDRVPYVIVRGTKKQAAHEKAEDPIYVLGNKLPLDQDYYLHQQLEKPLCRIFDPMMDDKAGQILFNLGGDHMMSKTDKGVANKTMACFFKKGLEEGEVSMRCLKCRANLPVGDTRPTCGHCRPKAPSIFIKTVMQLRDVERRFGRLWSECQNCAGSLQEEIFCSARDCPIFYMREKVRLDLKELTETHDRFSNATPEDA